MAHRTGDVVVTIAEVGEAAVVRVALHCPNMERAANIAEYMLTPAVNQLYRRLIEQGAKLPEETK